MCIVAVVSCIILVLIESDLCDCIRNFTFRALPEEKDQVELDLDEDVLEEEERVANLVA